jgi:hypothetical protein
MNAFFHVFVLVIGAMGIIAPEYIACEPVSDFPVSMHQEGPMRMDCSHDVADETSLRSKLIALVEQDARLVQKAVEQLKEHDRACTGPLIGNDGTPVWAHLFKDLQPSPLIKGLETFGPAIEEMIAMALWPHKEHIPTLQLLHVTTHLRLVRQALVPMGEYFLECYAARKGQLVHAMKMWGDLGTKQYITSTDVMKSIAQDEFEIFDTNVDKILASLHGDTQIFMACAFNKIRAYLAAGYLASNKEEMAELLFFNRLGFKLFSEEVLFNPAYSHMWQSIRIAGDKDIEDSEFFVPFIAAINEVFMVAQQACIAKIKALMVSPEATKLINEYALEMENRAVCFLRNTSRMTEKLLGIIGMQYSKQLVYEVLQECLV